MSDIRQSQRAAWDGLATGWAKWDSVIMAQLAPVGDAMIESLGIRPDQQHLDIASGTGEPGLTVARLAPHGQIVLTDLSPAMLDVAIERAASLGVANVVTQVCSADELPFGDEVFDSVSVRFGYMFFSDFARPTNEFTRVLKPGGRLVASVWVRPEENPWTSIVMRAISAEIELQRPQPGEPHMFRCADDRQIATIFEMAGLSAVSEWDVGVELVTSSPQEYWVVMSEHVSLVVAALRRLDTLARERIEARVLAEVAAYERAGQVRVPGLARCIVCTKPARGNP